MTAILATRQRSPWARILLGGAVLGTLDLLFACVFWAALRGVAPIRILQSIAAGVQGGAAFDGGVESALLGALCHYFIATVMVLAYYAASGRMHALVAQPLRYGVAYGLLLYVVMTYAVVPLSNAPQPAHAYVPWVLASIFMHAVFGVICAWCSRRARGFGN